MTEEFYLGEKRLEGAGGEYSKRVTGSHQF